MQNRTPKEIGAEVRNLLRPNRLTQTGLASHLGLSRQALIRRLNGEVDFSASEIASIAALTDTTTDSFLVAS